MENHCVRIDLMGLILGNYQELKGNFGFVQFIIGLSSPVNTQIAVFDHMDRYMRTED